MIELFLVLIIVIVVVSAWRYVLWPVCCLAIWNINDLYHEPTNPWMRLTYRLTVSAIDDRKHPH